MQKPLACASLLTNVRSSAHPQKTFVLWMGFFKSVAKQGQASPVPGVPRMQSSALCCITPQAGKSSPWVKFWSGACCLKPNPCLGGWGKTRRSQRQESKEGSPPDRPRLTDTAFLTRLPTLPENRTSGSSRVEPLHAFIQQIFY